MKEKSKKLQLGKETIAKLNNDLMKQVYGGQILTAKNGTKYNDPTITLGTTLVSCPSFQGYCDSNRTYCSIILVCYPPPKIPSKHSICTSCTEFICD